MLMIGFEEKEKEDGNFSDILSTREYFLIKIGQDYLKDTVAAPADLDTIYPLSSKKLLKERC